MINKVKILSLEGFTSCIVEEVCFTYFRIDSVIVQDDVSLRAFRLRHSVTQGYLQGSKAPYDLCRQKLVTDVALLSIRLNTITLEKINRQKAASAMDELGIMGRPFRCHQVRQSTELVFF